MQSTILPAIYVLEQVKICLKQYCENESLVSPGLRRPVVSNRDKVFQQIVEYLRADDEEQITLNDLKELMDSFLKDSPHEAFTTKWIKHELQEQLKDEIVITEINGKPNIVTFRTIAAKRLRNFYCKQRCSDLTGEK